MSATTMRDAVSLRTAVLVLALGAVTAVAHGQEPRPASLTVQGFATNPDGVELTFSWRFHPGDDPAWADPTFDDAAWEAVEPEMALGHLPPGGWPGIGWFRRHLRVEPALWGVPLLMGIREAGAADVYLDGKLLHRDGAPAAGVAPEWPATRKRPWPFVFSARPDHVIAVRYSVATRALGKGAAIGFTLSMHETDTVMAARAAVAMRTGILLAALATVLVFVALLHGALYWFYPKLRENLFYAVFMALFAVLVFNASVNMQATRTPWEELLNRVMAPAPVLIILLGQLTYYAVRTKPFPRSWKAFAAAAAVLAPASYFSPEPYATLIWCGYFVAMLGEVVRVELSGRTVAREGVAILLVGMAVLAAFIVLQVLVNLRVIPALAGFNAVYAFGVLASVLTMSLFLARTVARTNLHLERRLVEVEALTAQLLEQERTAHRNELRQRLLEAENARKTGELEAGRALQLSMLPRALPEVEGLEIAVAMSTASEVGGDYYDFRQVPGGLIVAVGDATGHGVAAGILVTAVKALFATLAGETGLAPMLAECDRVLRGMNLKHLHMCLAVAHIGTRSVTVCSAAMPPLLVRRADSGRVEEVGAGGLPLGGSLSPAYEERSAALGPGDTLLFATDGFPELLDPEGKPFGCDGVAEALRVAGGAPAREVVERLTAAAVAWRREREQADDITFVVARVTA